MKIRRRKPGKHTVMMTRADRVKRVKRVPVDYRYDAINPDFLKALARLGAYAAEKYGAWEQYTKARLVGEKSPINHAREHLRSYEAGERYDHFDGDPRWHLAAAAYNAMMEFYYASRFGLIRHPLAARPLGAGKGDR